MIAWIALAKYLILDRCINWFVFIHGSSSVERKKAAIVRRQRARRTDSTKPLIAGNSESYDFRYL